MYAQLKKLRVILMLVITQTVMFASPWSYGGVIFEDDFDSQPSTWNLGQGAPITPAGQVGTWGYLGSNVRTCSSLGCSNCSDLPADADDYVTYMDDTGGVNSSQALRWVMKNDCSIDDYPGSIDWRLPLNTYKETYFGFHLKVDPEWKTTGSEQCKFPFWIALGDKPLEGRVWGTNQDMTMPGDSPLGFAHVMATPGYRWLTEVTDSEFADGEWHWIEFRIKLNTFNGSEDGVMTLWFDGIQRSTLTGLTFWPSTASQSDWIYAIRLQLGNCSGTAESWANSNWAGFWIDNFKGGTSYIGPPSSTPPPSDTTSPTVPSNLTTTAVSSSQINLSWSASTDDTAVTGYKVYRSGTKIADVTTTAYSNIGLLANTTYTYAVAAYDAAGNVSAQSAGVSATTEDTTTPPPSSTILFEEPFEDSDFAARGWYDIANGGGTLSSTEHIPGSTMSFECRFLVGDTNCNAGRPGRIQFEETESVYLSYWVKHSANWIGSNKPYHPHEFYFLTNKDGAWTGPAFTYLTAYVETNGGMPRLSIQDGKNVDQTQVGQDLIGITENRSVSGCNGAYPDGYENFDCYDKGDGNYVNFKHWVADQVYFSDSSGPYDKNDWHKVEAYFQLNSIQGGIGQADGILQYWYDGELIMNHTNVMFRTGANADMKFNHMLISPYIGDGSPVDQRLWIDDLVIATGSSAIGLTAPQNLRIAP